MTIGIALTLEDGALLVADGMTTYLFNDTERVLKQDNEKIVRVGPSLAVIKFGVSQATELAVKGLKAVFDAGLDPSTQELEQLVDNCAKLSWDKIAEALEEKEYLDNSAMKVGLVAGGLAQGVPFICGALHYHNGQSQPVLKTGRGNSIVLGGEDQNARQMFNKPAGLIIDTMAGPPGTKPTDELIKALIDCAATTIRTLEKQDDSIGGTIRYALIRRGLGYQSGIYNA
jgi:hypothetical protein